MLNNGCTSLGLLCRFIKLFFDFEPHLRTERIVIPPVSVRSHKEKTGLPRFSGKAGLIEKLEDVLQSELQDARISRFSHLSELIAVHVYSGILHDERVGKVEPPHPSSHLLHFTDLDC